MDTQEVKSLVGPITDVVDVVIVDGKDCYEVSRGCCGQRKDGEGVIVLVKGKAAEMPRLIPGP